MPISARTDIEIAQRAMVLVGLEPLTSFTDNSDEALVMNTLYEDMVEDCLSQHSCGSLVQNLLFGQIACLSREISICHAAN